MPTRPFRFLAEAGGVIDGKTLAHTARRAEAIGVSVLVVSDHLVDKLAPLATMATAAAATERLRVAPFVLNNDLRHPAVLAQELASLDVLTGGRLEVALGAGWNEPEYDAVGIPFDPGSVRLARLSEAVTVLKRCFAEGSFDFTGQHYVIRGYDARPKPVQKPHPPLFIGGGSRRILTLAAQEADIVGLTPRPLPNGVVDPRSLTLAATEEKVRWVRQAAGDRFTHLELNVYPSQSPVVVTDHARREVSELARRFETRSGIPISADELLESPHIFIGSIDGLVEKFTMLRERLGISSIMVGQVDDLVPVVERLAGT